jgi:hypothetical protein
MARPKIKQEDQKGKLGISISKLLLIKIENETNNKSKFIEDLIKIYFENNANTRRN